MQIHDSTGSLLASVDHLIYFLRAITNFSRKIIIWFTFLLVRLAFVLFHESVKRWYLCVSITMCPLWNPALQIVYSMLIGLRGGMMYCPVCWFDSVTVQIENTLSQWNTWFTKSGCDAGIHGSTSLWTTDFLPHERLAHSFLLLCWILQLLMVHATGVLAYIP